MPYQPTIEELQAVIKTHEQTIAEMFAKARPLDEKKIRALWHLANLMETDGTDLPLEFARLLEREHGIVNREKNK